VFIIVKNPHIIRTHCICGIVSRKVDIFNHIKTKKHTNFVNSQGFCQESN
jgi:hypothetical protein